jgi:hypothetical protein
MIEKIEFRPNLFVLNANFTLLLQHKVPPRCIVAVAHDGVNKSSLSGLFRERAKGENGKRAIHGRDQYVWPIAKDIVISGYENGFAIDAVHFQMPRAFIDTNRPLSLAENLDLKTPQTALDDHALIPVYRHYLRTIEELVKRSIKTHGVSNVLFVDLHGFTTQPYYAPSEGFDLILGTANRVTIPHGNIDRAFSNDMSEKGYRVFLPQKTRQNLKNEDAYDAGQMTRYVANAFNVNAIQIETARRFRQRDSKVIGEKLACDIAHTVALRLGAG